MENTVYLKPFSGLKISLLFVAFIFLSVSLYIVVNDIDKAKLLLYLIPGLIIILYLVIQPKIQKHRYIKTDNKKLKIKRYRLTKEIEIPLADIANIKIINSRIAVKIKNSNQIIINLDWVSGESKQKCNKMFKNLSEKYNFDFSVITFTDILKKEK